MGWLLRAMRGLLPPGTPLKGGSDKTARWTPAAMRTAAGHEALVLLFLLISGSVAADQRSGVAAARKRGTGGGRM
ncbi:hypothetical protein E2C01_052006 [Portunus trituberculatus]|uniref:Uncharacterized protein n=1 Tax=Portunus trituberculatus TaxID=210409 RepID=A0A5B7GN92_PORTR|nr:hypothetical protein [Portunus trituberculatus]